MPPNSTAVQGSAPLQQPVFLYPDHFCPTRKSPANSGGGLPVIQSFVFLPYGKRHEQPPLPMSPHRVMISYFWVFSPPAAGRTQPCLLVTAPAVPAVAVTASTGLAGLPQRADSQCYHACENQQNDNFSRGHTLLLLTVRRRPQMSAGDAPSLPDSPCGTTGRGCQLVGLPL